MNILKLLIFCVLFLSIFVSCSYGETDDRNEGILVDRDVLSSIIKDEQDKENSLLANDGDVFWTPSGTIWHATYECSYLSTSKEIYHGSVEDAMLDGKERECSRCFSDDIDKAYSDLEGNPIEKNDVFFTKDDEKWHSDINCPHILGADNVYNASMEKAKELGKTVACDECNDR